MALSDWLIWISFSNCPRRCCFSLAHAAQASMARFYFHDISFLCRKAQRTKPAFCKRTHKHRSARENARMFASGKLQDQTYLSSQKYSLQPWRVARVILATDIERLSLLTFWICHFGFFLLEFSLPLCASIIIFLNRRVPRSEILRCLTKGKGASPSASKTLVRPKYHPCFIIFERQICMGLLRYVPL